MIEFDVTGGVFEDKDILTDRYEPDEIKERDDQKDMMRDAYNDMFRYGAGADNILIYGSTGVGKTVVTKNELIESIKKSSNEADHLDTEIVWHNIKGMSRHKASVAITNEILPNKNPAKPGQAQDVVYDHMIDAINERDASHMVFALDEIDALGVDDDLLYKLSRMDSHGYLDVDTKISIIGISNSMKFKENLSSRVCNQMNAKDILFPEYDATELMTILEPRAKKAFKDGAIDTGIINLAASLTAQERGSARRGLDILAQAGKLADREDADEVSADHLREACSEIEHELIKEDISNLSTQSQITIQALMMLEQKGVERPRIKRVYSLYKKLADRADIPVRSRRTIKRKMQDLKLKDFVTIATINNGSDGGRYNVYELNLDVGMVDNVISEVDRLSTSANQSIQSYSSD